MSVSDEVLKEGIRLSEAATAAPWHWVRICDHWEICINESSYVSPSVFAGDNDESDPDDYVKGVGDQEAEANAKLTVYMRNHFPAIAQELLEARKEIARLQEICRGKETNMSKMPPV